MNLSVDDHIILSPGDPGFMIRDVPPCPQLVGTCTQTILDMIMFYFVYVNNLAHNRVITKVKKREQQSWEVGLKLLIYY